MDLKSLLLVDVAMAIFGLIATLYFVPYFGRIFEQSDLVKMDMHKPDEIILPDALGVIGCLIYIVCMVLLTPFVFMEADLIRTFNAIVDRNWLQWIPNLNLLGHEKCFCCYRKDLIPYFASLFCFSLMSLFGFMDDVLVLKRKRRFFIPALAAFPLVVFYFTSFGNTTFVIPRCLKWILGDYLNFGPFYYLFICVFASVCAHSLDKMSQLDGLISGQCLVINASIIIHNFLELDGPAALYHRYSIIFMIPFFGVTLGLFFHNRYPASVQIGDTFSFSAGMIFAVIAILGHFSEMLILFFLPQLLNLIYSLPQLFFVLPYPRRRTPKYNSKLGLLVYSRARLKQAKFMTLGGSLLNHLEKAGLAKVDNHPPENPSYKEFNNLSIDNLILLKMGPMEEKRLTLVLITLQLFCCSLALLIRYMPLLLIRYMPLPWSGLA